MDWSGTASVVKLGNHRQAAGRTTAPARGPRASMDLRMLPLPDVVRNKVGVFSAYKHTQVLS